MANYQQENIIEEIREERRKQDAKWGEQNHTPEWWMIVLNEEVGEACQAVLHTRFRGRLSIDDYRAEMIQVAAVALAALECLDRNKEKEKEKENG